MATTVEDAADTYQTYKVISADEPLSFPIKKATLINDTFYFSIDATETTFFCKLDLDTPTEYAFANSLIENKDDSLHVQANTVTIQFEDNLNDAAIQFENTSIPITVQRDPFAESTLKNELYIEDDFKTKLGVYTWISTHDPDKNDTGFIKEIDTISRVEEETLYFTVLFGDEIEEFALPLPKNADSETNISAEFVEQSGGGIQLIDGAQIIVARESEINSKETVATSTTTDLVAFTPDQYETYVVEYNPTKHKLKNDFQTGAKSFGKRLLQPIFTLGSMWIFYNFFILPWIKSEMTSSVVNTFIELFNTAFLFFGIAIIGISLFGRPQQRY